MMLTPDTIKPSPVPDVSDVINAQEYAELHNRLNRVCDCAYACREVRRWIRKGLGERNPDVDEPEYDIANNILAAIQNDIEYYEKLRQEALDEIAKFEKKELGRNDA